MSDHRTRYEGLIERFVAWAATRPDVPAAFVVGSRAREIAPADAWSDLDVVMFADDPAALLDDGNWLTHLGDPEITFREPTAVGMWEERRVLFADGCDADFSILPAQLIDELAATSPGERLHDETSGVVARGYRVLVDSGGRLAPVLAMLAATAPPTPGGPAQAIFDQVLADFWYHCVWTSRKIRRGELAVAHECLEGTQRHLLLTMIRWLGARDTDTWHGMRFFERWAPATVQERYARTFARHDAADLERALVEMMDLVSWITGELADAFALRVDPAPEQAARRWVRQALDTG